MRERGEVQATHAGHTLRITVAVLWVLAVMVITLVPGETRRAGTENISWLCLVCGSRGGADAILNVVLFLPVGILWGYRRRVTSALLAGFLISLAIEVTQLFLPGRNPAMGDLVWNTAGAGIGAWSATMLRRWLGSRDLSSAAPARWALGLPTAYLLLAGILAQPMTTSNGHIGVRAPTGAGTERYQGRMLSARVDGQEIPWGAYADDAPKPDVRREFEAGAIVEKGPPPEAISLIVAVFDSKGREIFLLGAQREDLIWRQLDRGQVLRFDRREIRAEGALAMLEVGDTMVVSAFRTGRTLCLAVDGWEQCGLGMTPGHTWTYLMNLEGASPAFRTALDTAWMATLFFLVGLLGAGVGRTLGWGLLSVVVVVLAVASTPLVFGSWLDWLGLVLGIALGRAVRPTAGKLVGLPVRPEDRPDQGSSPGAATPTFTG